MEKGRQERETLYQRLAGGIFFSQNRYLTKDALRRVIDETDFNKPDLTALESIEICAPSHGPIALVMPVRQGPAVWLSPEFETEEPESVKAHVANALANAVAIANGAKRNNVATETKEIIQRWGFPVVHTEQTQREGAAA